ncbi:MAG: hypothetical protein O7F69_02050 [Alphaproteobacteria bacterium]|nr:hypothetical protein [Alphaproteobacteria bacterium]
MSRLRLATSRRRRPPPPPPPDEPPPPEPLLDPGAVEAEDTAPANPPPSEEAKSLKPLSRLRPEYQRGL